MRVSILGSGSAGNSIFIEIDNFKLLIDAGYSGKRIAQKLHEIGEKPENIGAILVTHEHMDHIKGAGILSRKHNIPIFISRESYEASNGKLGKIDGKNLVFLDEANFKLGNSVEVTQFEVMHDAVKTVGYTLQNSRGHKLAVSTDIGYVTNIVRENFKGAHIVILESNYDYQMLMDCSYPWDLKARVKGRNGHLSNNEAAKFIREIYHDELKKVFLVHISQDSNSYELAHKTVSEELARNEICVDLELVEQEKISSLFELYKND